MQRAALQILDRLRAGVPDLSRAVVLVPNFHAGRRLARTLAVASGSPVLIPPRITTLAAWAETVPARAPLLPDSRRASLLFQALKSRGWFPDRDLWPLVAELVRLFDEITACTVGLPGSLADFAARLRAAYETRAGRALEFEARLVHELWYAISHEAGAARDATAHYALQLAWLADHADSPLFALDLPALSPMERDFLDRYATRQAVTMLTAGVDADPVARTLAAAWPEGEAPPVATRAGTLRAALPASPLSDRIRLYGAKGLEDEAHAADAQVRAWLIGGKTAVALVAQDRLVARRVRALLERAEVRVADETGWTLSTTAASAVVMRWLDCVTGDFGPADVLDVLKSPFVLADLGDAARREAAARVEEDLRRHGPAAGLAGLRARLGHAAEAAAARAVLTRLAAARGPLAGGRRTLADWLGRLRRSLETLAATQPLNHDAAGRQVLAQLASRERELAPDAGRYTLAEWRRWLAAEMETAGFVETGVESPVVFTHLAATRGRAFDAVLILGADAAHLPPPPAASAFFNQRVRADLGLPTHADALAQLRADLVALVAATPEVCITWRAWQEGEKNLPSPYFERLDTLHRLAWKTSLEDTRLAALIRVAAVPAPHPAQPPAARAAPHPRLPTDRVPARVSPSGYASLMACPYQYFARHVLRLNELDEIDAEMEKADYGRIVHAVLKRIHERFPVFLDVPDAELEMALRDETEAAFRGAVEADFLAHSWRLRWTQRIPGYIRWQKQREGEGWRWHAGELDRRTEFALRDGATVTLAGRLDRMDTRGEDAAVLDYKTSSGTRLRKRIEEPGEDVQLAAYVLMLNAKVTDAAYVALDDEEVRAVHLADAAVLATVSGQRLAGIFEALHAGAGLPAHGADKVCEQCEMRGLCRKDYWL